MDASQMLKPALARGEVRCMGATTLGEYLKHIEKDAALARRFQQVGPNARLTFEDLLVGAGGFCWGTLGPCLGLGFCKEIRVVGCVRGQEKGGAVNSKCWIRDMVAAMYMRSASESDCGTPRSSLRSPALQTLSRSFEGSNPSTRYTMASVSLIRRLSPPPLSPRGTMLIV